MDPQIGGLDRPILWPIWYSAFECCLIIFLSYSLEKDIFTTCTGNKDWTWTFPRTDNDIDDSRLGSYFFRWKSIKIKSRLLQHGETNLWCFRSASTTIAEVPISFATKSHENPSQTHKYLPKFCFPIFSGKLCWKRLCVRGRKHGQTMVSLVDSPNKTFASHMAGPRHDLGAATGRSRWPRSLAIPGFKASSIANKREDWHGQLTLIQHLPIVINS